MQDDFGSTFSPSNNGETSANEGGISPDYQFVQSTARIAVYDDLRSAPRIIEIRPNTTAEYIEDLASTVHHHAQRCGGNIPYTIIREVTENFIHARFAEIIVSILDRGETIRFADQGPGIVQKDKAQLPGFSSANEHMKRYIRGVGSGLPIVKDYLSAGGGTITIEDNIRAGAVVTISMVEKKEEKPDYGRQPAQKPKLPMPMLSLRGKDFLKMFLSEGALGVTDLVKLTGSPQSSAHSELKKLEEAGLIENTAGKKRVLTDYGYEVASLL